MPDVTVHPHGSRWAVATSDSSSPVREFETREAAITSARSLAGDGSVEVLEEDPSSLGEERGAAQPEGAEIAPEAVDGMDDPERPRTEQGGL
jgi:Uncharacterized protein conserved in bacteria (DUF2188)